MKITKNMLASIITCFVVSVVTNLILLQISKANTIKMLKEKYQTKLPTNAELYNNYVGKVANLEDVYITKLDKGYVRFVKLNKENESVDWYTINIKDHSSMPGFDEAVVSFYNHFKAYEQYHFTSSHDLCTMNIERSVYGSNYNKFYNIGHDDHGYGLCKPR